MKTVVDETDDIYIYAEDGLVTCSACLLPYHAGVEIELIGLPSVTMESFSEISEHLKEHIARGDSVGYPLTREAFWKNMLKS